MKKNDFVTLQIDDVTLQGSGVGHVEGLTVFVPGTCTGETVTAHILKVKSNCAFAKAAEILSPAPARIPADCPVYGKCGGCAFRHMTYAEELKIKENQVLQLMRRIGKTDVPVSPILGAESPAGYRNKAQYPVCQNENGLQIGFYAPRSHRVVDCRHCKLEPDAFGEILEEVAAWQAQWHVTAYDELAHTGTLRHIYIRKAFATGEILVCLVVKDKIVAGKEDLVDRLCRLNENIKSICVNFNTERTNVIMGRKLVNLYGDGTITDVLCGKKIRISPLSFYQVNHDQAQVLYRKAAEYAQLSGSETVLDLYCGAGTIGLSMAEQAGRIIGVEIVPEAVRDAKENAKRNGAQNAEFYCEDAAQAAARLQREGITPDVILLDPPRKGCDPALLETVAQMAPKRLVYISCDPATLARDIARLAPLGYTPQALTPVDLFPRTAHVETVVLMSRA